MMRFENWLYTLPLRVRSLVLRRRQNADLHEELLDHIDRQIEENVAHGMREEEARQAAVRAFGNLVAVREQTHDSWPWVSLERLGQDFLYAFRQTRRSPGFAAVAISTLALGIGAATALFTVVDHVILQPIAYKDPGRLVQILKISQYFPTGTEPDWTDIEQWMNQSRSFESMAYWLRMRGRGNFLVKEPISLEIRGTRVSTNFFETLGVRPEIGRDFVSEEPSKAAGSVVISDALWRTAFAAEKGIVGSAIRINDKSYTVIGVMPPGFSFPANSNDQPQVWVPIDPAADEVASQKSGEDAAGVYYFVLARLRPGVTLADAQTEMNMIQRRVAAQYRNPEYGKDQAGAQLTPYEQTLVRASVREALLALLGASLGLWLIAVVNVTGLLLARAASRQREIAMRSALGASLGRVLQRMLVEGLLLSGAASLLGLGLSIASVKLLARQLKDYLPLGAPPFVPDISILLGLLSMTLLTAAMATLWPAWMAARAPIEPALRQGGQQAGTGRHQHRVRGVLVSIEIAMSLTLLVSCGLLLRTIYTLRQVPLGFRVDHILVASLDIPRYRFAGHDLMSALYQPLLERVQQMRGIEAAGLMSRVPLGPGETVGLGIPDNGKVTSAAVGVVSPQVQRILGMHMLVGRFFNGDDTPGSDAKVVVNRAFAQAYAPDKRELASVIGMDMWQLKKGRPLHIVGVLDDQHAFSIAAPSFPEAEVCTCQLTPDVDLYGLANSEMQLLIRSSRPEKDIVPELRTLLRQAAPELEQVDISTMEQIVEDSYGSQRLAAHLLAGFGGAALLLCVAGIYGLLAYVVAQRTHELGIRIALGASRVNILWMVMRQAGTMLLFGVAMGAVNSWLSSRFVRSFLYGVRAHDGWTLASAAVVLCACGLFAAYIPARRATRVDLVVALHSE